MNRRPMGVLVGSFEPGQQTRERLLRPVVPHRYRQGLPLADDHHQFPAPRDVGVNEVALQQQVGYIASGVSATGNSDPWDLWLR